MGHLEHRYFVGSIWFVLLETMDRPAPFHLNRMPIYTCQMNVNLCAYSVHHVAGGMVTEKLQSRSVLCHLARV
jgi:hypothetical protein